MCKFRDFDKYEIYEDGRIWSYKSKKFLKPHTLPSGYQQVHLYDNEGKSKMYRLHRVIYESVSGEPIPECYDVNHLNECKTDSRFDNLNLLTRKENINFGTRNERASKSLTNNTKRSKQVGAFKDGELVMTFPSTNEAGRQGFCQVSVSDCCNGKLKTHKGYTWRYL